MISKKGIARFRLIAERQCLKFSTCKVADWETIVGLEMHAQMASKQKLFSESLVSSDSLANSQVSSFDRALPGYLPILNQECLELALRAAILFNCQIRPVFTFDRKHYVYPDLPHGYQITQYYEPYATYGYVVLRHFSGQKIPLERIQIEIDSGKTIDLGSGAMKGSKFVDLNRAGTGLLEIVTGPVFRSPALGSGSLTSRLVVQFAKTIQQMLRQAGICHGNLEAGHLRFDVNVSVTGPLAPQTAGPLGTRVEIKNLNSFAALAQAIDAEAERQIYRLNSGLSVEPHETRGFDISRRKTFLLRVKEGPTDYRFIREYDIPEIRIEKALIDRIRAEMPLTLEQIETLIQSKYNLKSNQVALLLADPALFDYFKRTVELCGAAINAAQIFNWITIELVGQLNRRNFSLENSSCSPQSLADLLGLLSQGKIDRNSAKTVLATFLDSSDNTVTMENLASKMGLILEASSEFSLEPIHQACIDQLQQEPDKAVQVVNGTRSLDYFIGPLMKRFRGIITPQKLRQILNDALQNSFVNK